MPFSLAMLLLFSRIRRAPRPLVVIAMLAAVAAWATPAHAAGSVPAGWPTTLSLGLADPENGAAALGAQGGVAFRYQYLAGGVNTGQDWTAWATGNGSFVPNYVTDSRAHGLIPVFTYYNLYQSLPAGGHGAEPTADLGNLRNPATMAAYYADLRELFQRAAQAGGLIVVHVEPDAWGYVQRAAVGDNAATVPAAVAASGVPELAGLPDTAAGFGQAVVRLRDRYAPNVVLGYHLSIWGTGEDIGYSKPSPDHLDSLAARSAAFFRSLGAPFDLVFAEFADRDAGQRLIEGHDGGASFWSPADFARHARYLADVSAGTGRRVVLWQIPLGNTVMRAENNTPGHYQDTRVQTLLQPATRSALRAYDDAGVIGLLFGGGVPGSTCACDAQHDGVTNPAPIDGNLGASLNADDDGGLFHSLARAYAAAPLTLAGVALPGAVPAARHGRLTVGARVRGRVRRGATVRVRLTISEPDPAALVASAELLAPHGRVVARGRLALSSRPARTLGLVWHVPRTARSGAYRVRVDIFAGGGRRVAARPVVLVLRLR